MGFGYVSQTQVPVYGYTGEKVPVLVELSIDLIVDKGIDPWRIDLLDPDPVPIKTQRGLLYFSKLRDCAFAQYDPQDSSRLSVSLWSEGEPACVVGRWRALVNGNVVVTGLQPSALSFAERLCEFLRHQDHFSPELDRTPSTAAAVTLKGSELIFSHRANVLCPKQLNFTGAMFNEGSAGILLDGRINWLLESFGKWRPIVFGQGLRQSLLGQVPEIVEFLIDDDGFQFISRNYRCEEGLAELFFRHDGCKYSATATRTDSLSLRKFIGGLEGKGSVWSTDLLFAEAGDWVTGSAIAFHDLSLKQTRLLKFKSLKVHTPENLSLSSLEQELGSAAAQSERLYEEAQTEGLVPVQPECGRLQLRACMLL